MSIAHRRAVHVALWTLLWLLLADLAIHVATDRQSPWASRVGGLARYFDYGRSIEGKLAAAIGPQGDRPNAIVQAGWIDPEAWRALPTKASDDGLLVAVYGQSFAFNAARAMQQLDGHMTLRLIGGPAAPLSHSYAAYRADAPLRRAQVVVVGVLASSMAKADSMSALSWTFESPAPYTFPRFTLRDGRLDEVTPVLRTEQAFRRAFAEQGQDWRDFKAQLAAHDRGYDRFAFDGGALDASALMRLVRRGWVANAQQYEDAATEPARDEVAVEMLRELRRKTTDAGERLVVVLLHDRGHDGQLERRLAGPLKALGIEFVSTQAVFSAADPANFIADGHYTEAANQRLAHALWRAVRPQAATVAAQQ